MRTDPPNQFRQKGPHMMQWDSTDADGMNGAFSIPMPPCGRVVNANCIVSDGRGMVEFGREPWEHVSVHIVDNGKQRTPSWNEMCLIKKFFWRADETVVEYHPAESNYVNLHPCVLHLWRRVDGFPTPPIECV